MFVWLTHAARLLFGFDFLLNGINWWWKLLPYPSVWDPPLRQTPPFVQAMIDTGFMFDGIKVVEVVVGLLLLANRWVPLALVVAFPVTVAIWSVDFFLISMNVRAQVMGWSALALNTFLLFAYLNCYAPMLVSQATPSIPHNGLVQDRTIRSKGLLLALGFVAIALGLAVNAWLIVMVIQQS